MHPAGAKMFRHLGIAPLAREKENHYLKKEESRGVSQDAGSEMRGSKPSSVQPQLLRAGIAGTCLWCWEQSGPGVGLLTSRHKQRQMKDWVPKHWSSQRRAAAPHGQPLRPWDPPPRSSRCWDGSTGEQGRGDGCSAEGHPSKTPHPSVLLLLLPIICGKGQETQMRSRNSRKVKFNTNVCLHNCRAAQFLIGHQQDDPHVH